MKTIDTPKGFARFAAAYADRDADARAWKAAGGKVAGYMTNTVPVELLRAAGFFPLQLSGGVPGAPTPRADRYMEELFDPIVRSVFERLLAGDYAFLDLIVLPRTSDSVQRLYYYLVELKRRGEADLPEVLMFDLLHTPWYSSAEYNFDRMAEFRDRLQGLGDGDINAALPGAIARANASRERLGQLCARRHARPAALSGEAALQALAASQLMEEAAFDTALAEALAEDVPSAPAGPRLVLAGSPLDHAGLHRLVSDCGGSVVGDYHGYGEQMLGGQINTAMAPLRALTEHYHRTVFSSRRFPADPKALAEFAVAAGADGVIFYFFAEEEALTWEYPGQRKALEAAGLGALCFTLQPYAMDAASLKPQVQAFIDGLASR